MTMTAGLNPARSPALASTAERSLRAGLPAWSIHAWPTLVCRADDPHDWRLNHLGTRVLNLGDDDHPSCGQTLWGSDVGEGAAAVAWDWIELCPGVLALADPLGLISNVHLVDGRGEPLPELQVALHLNHLVRALPWQSEVQRAIDGRLLN